jgi:hypothetical protein
MMTSRRWFQEIELVWTLLKPDAASLPAPATMLHSAKPVHCQRPESGIGLCRADESAIANGGHADALPTLQPGRPSLRGALATKQSMEQQESEKVRWIASSQELLAMTLWEF